LRVSSKKIIPVIILVLILFAGILALTDELDMLLPELEQYDDDFFGFESDDGSGFGVYREMPQWAKPARWFRSNSGGMALEEMQSSFTALRQKYALAVDFVHRDELPDYLISYYKEEYLLEVRILYKDGVQQRTQWIFRDEKGNTRLNAVFLEPASESIVMEDFSAVQDNAALPVSEEGKEEIKIEEANAAREEVHSAHEETNATREEVHSVRGEVPAAQEEANAAHKEVSAAHEEIINAVEITQEEEIESEIEINTENETAAADRLDFPLDVKNKKGFLELFNEESFLTSEFWYYENGRIARTDYSLNENLLIKAEYKEWNVKENEGEYKNLYTDYYRYNRSLSLRNIERVFHADTQISDPVRVAFPRRIMDAAQSGIFISERLNIYPEYFGDVYVDIDSKMVFDTDNRGRIMSQTLYGSDGEVIWSIANIWQNNRIVSSVKTEGDTVLLAEFAYNSNGDMILERNSRDGVLERVVKTEGKSEIEELYMNNAIVLRAVWENGRKISETRVRN